jgi:hypothetical protein
VADFPGQTRLLRMTNKDERVNHSRPTDHPVDFRLLTGYGVFRSVSMNLST